ncbi:hypothetical protein ACGF12_30440 [Kitasatospora sp. NPDC048296]|uniref:hypothetical protein n=1 Tax=Kitasatospora sp. NPDC048296 TaxID=3364048 RepID=UPI0037162AD2
MAAAAAYCTQCCAVVAVDGPTEPFHCPHCGGTDHTIITAAQVGAAQELADAIGDGYLLYDVSGSSAGLTCSEAEVFCGFLRAYGRPSTADGLLLDHAEHDDEGDSHGIDAEGKVFTRA